MVFQPGFSDSLEAKTMKWVALYRLTLKQPLVLDTLANHGIAALESSPKVLRRVASSGRIGDLYFLCLMLDTHSVALPSSVVRCIELAVGIEANPRASLERAECGGRFIVTSPVSMARFHRMQARSRWRPLCSRRVRSDDARRMHSYGLADEVARSTRARSDDSPLRKTPAPGRMADAKCSTSMRCRSRPKRFHSSARRARPAPSDWPAITVLDCALMRRHEKAHRLG